MEEENLRLFIYSQNYISIEKSKIAIKMKMTNIVNKIEKIKLKEVNIA